MTDNEATTPTAAKFKTGKYLTFTLGEEFYGVAVLKIREIIRMQKITPVPHVPAHVKGVINLRGKVIPVVDMRLKFSLGNDEVTERTCIVVVQITKADKTNANVGLVVDAVEEVVTIQAEDVEETPDLGSQFENEYILGIAKIKGEVKTLLDIDRVVLEDAARIMR